MGIPQMLAAGLQTAGALAENVMGASALSKQSEAAARNLAGQYQVGLEQEREAGEQAAEQTTDRMREAQRQLSMARVIAAQGGGSLAAMATNIAAGAAEDASRIEVSKGKTVTSVRDQMNNGRVQLDNFNSAIKQQGKAMQMRFLTQVAGSAASAYVGSQAKAAEIKTTSGFTADYRLPKIKLGG